MAAECGLKRLMQRFGMPIDAITGIPSQEHDRKHANSIWARFESYLNGKVEGVGYALPASNPFDDWDVSDRYAHQVNFDQNRVQSHQAGAQLVCDRIRKARREGLI